jgi:hypothetical protein
MIRGGGAKEAVALFFLLLGGDEARDGDLVSSVKRALLLEPFQDGIAPIASYGSGLSS